MTEPILTLTLLHISGNLPQVSLNVLHGIRIKVEKNSISSSQSFCTFVNLLTCSFFYDKKIIIINSGFLITAKAVLVYVCEKGRVIVIFLMDRINQYSLCVFFLIEEKR